jgi:parallel beta-helix repeat protein
MNGSRTITVFATFFLLAVAAVGTASAATLSVPTPAYPTIQAAIDAAANGDVIVVAPGTYTECINFNGKAITVQSTNPTSPTVVAATIIDGNKAGSVVSFKSGETGTSVLAGLTITNGTGTIVDPYTPLYGGGVFCWQTSPTLTNNIITGNSADDGGGVVCYDASPILTNNTISNNTATYSGGGVECLGPAASSTLTNNTISDNQAKAGGGVCCEISSATLANNSISGNSAGTGVGGGVYCVGGSTTLNHNTISANSADDGGGVVCNSGSDTLTNNTITRNSAYEGGGVSCWGSDGADSWTLTNNIISGNSATHGGGLYCLLSRQPVLTYCDVYGNTGGNYFAMTDPTGTSGNISVDPKFGADYRLKSQAGRWNDATSAWVRDAGTSPCIDAGDPASAYNQEPVPNGGRVNMGWDGDTPHASKTHTAVTYTIKGTVRNGSTGVAGVSITTTGASTTTAADGTYTLSALAASSYTVSAVKAEMTFSSVLTQPVVVNATFGSATGVDFTAIPPAVVSTTPANNATGVAINTPVTVTFSEAMLPVVTQNAFSLKNGTTIVAGTFSWGTLRKLMTFTPTAKLLPTTNYTLTITTGAQSAIGAPLAAPYSSQFTTAPAPVVLATWPANNTMGVAVSALVKVSFSEAMLPVVTQNAFILKHGTTIVAGTFSWSPLHKLMTFTPTAKLLPATKYRLTITTGAQSAVGGHLAAPYSAQFTTGAAPASAAAVAALAAPVLTAPEDGATGLSASPRLEWEAVAGAAGYLVQVATDEGFTSKVFVGQVTDMQQRLSGLAAGSVYYWRVQAYTNGATSPWSEVGTFTTGSG